MRDLAAFFALAERRSHIPFNWRGGRCCVSFMARAVQAQTGIDPRGTLKWNTRREALQVVKGEGGLIAAMDRRFDRIPPAMANRGDIAGIPDRLFGVRLMMIEGETLVGPGKRGLERQPRAEMTIAWDTSSIKAEAI